MVITENEYFDDKVRVHLSCKQPWGVPDEVSVVEVQYSVLQTLPAPPPMDRGHGVWQECWDEAVYIPAHDLSISFRFEKWQEADDGQMEALIGGPYLGRLQEPCDPAITPEGSQIPA
jgi:hypothetical protein